MGHVVNLYCCCSVESNTLTKQKQAFLQALCLALLQGTVAWLFYRALCLALLQGTVAVVAVVAVLVAVVVAVLVAVVVVAA